MGKVYRPEDLAKGRPQEIPDLATTPIPAPPMRGDIAVLRQEVESIRKDVDKIKQALRAHGINVE